MSPNSLSKKILLIFFCLYFFLAIVVPGQIKILNKASVSDLILFAVLIYYFGTFFISKDSSLKYLLGNIYDFIRRPLILSMVLLFVVMLVSVPYSTNKTIAVTESIRFFLYILTGFIVLAEFSSELYIGSFISTFAAATITVNIIGLYQFITKKGITVSLVNLTGSGFTGRIQSTFGNPNAFGAFLVITLFPFILLFLSNKNIRYKLIYLSVILLSFVNLLLTFSRNSWLAFAMGIVILAFIYNWKFIYLIVTGGAVMFLTPSISARIRQFTDVSQNESRIKIWSIALKMIKDHPIRGVGNGNFSELFDSYVEKYPQYYQENISHFPTHNSYLKIQSELGICGTLFFLCTLYFVFKNLITVYKKYTGNVKYFYQGFFVSTICFLVLNLFDNILFVPQVAIVFWVFVFVAQNMVITKEV